MAGEIVVGAVAVDIVPSAKEFLPKLLKAVAPAAVAAGKAAGESIEKEIADGAADGVKEGLKEGKRSAKRDGAEAGADFSGGFAAAVKAGLKAAQGAIGDFKVPVNLETDLTELGEARVELDKLKTEIKRVGDVDVDANLDDKLFLTKLANIKRQLRTLAGTSTDLGFGSEIRNATSAVDGLVEKIQSANTKTGAFARNVDSFYKGILSTFADTDFDIDARFVVSGTGEIDAAGVEVDRLRKKVAQFRTDNAKGLLDGPAVRKQIEQITADIEQLGKMPLGENLAYELGKVKQSTAAITKDLFGIAEEKVEVEVEADTRPAKVELEGFAREVARVAESASKAIGLRVNLDDDAVYPELARIKAALAGIAGRIGVDLDDAAALVQIRVLREELAELGKKHTANIGVSEDFKSVTGIIDKFNAGLDQGNGKLEGMAAALRKVAQQASSKISIRTDLNDDEFYVELAQIKAALNNIVVRVGVDMSAADAYAEIKALEAQLAILTRKRSIDVTVNREALNVGEVFQQAKSALDGATQSGNTFLTTLKNMTPAAQVANVSVIGMAAGLPVIILAATAALAGFLGLLVTIGAMAGVAALGVGVLALALSKITSAIQEREAVTKQAAATAAQAAQTEFTNATAIASADQAIASAETALARARVSASRSATQAARSLVSAQRNLVQANTKEADARKKLSAAYVDAKNDLKALNNEIRKNRIEQQAAVATITQAREAYNTLLADPTASQSEIQAAQAAYNTQEQNLRNLRTEQAKNATEKAKYDQFGLDANDGVISAQAALKSAIESVKDAQTSVTTAAENSAQAQIDAANSINDAEEALAQARTNRANTLKAQQLAAATTAATAATQTTDYDALTDKGKEFVTFYETKIKPIIDDLFKTAQNSGILSGIEGFFSAIQPILPQIKTLITTVGHQMGVFLIQIGNFLASDEGQDFIAFLGDTVKKLEPFMASLTKSGMSIFFTLLEALAPVLEQMAPDLAAMAEDFADMFAEFVKSDQFKEFIQTMIDNGPLMLETIVAILGAAVNLVNALAPAGAVILTVMKNMATFVGWLDTDLLGDIIATILFVIAAILLVAGTAVSIIVGLVLLVVAIVILIAHYWDDITAIVSAFIDWFVQGWQDCFNDAWETIQGWGRNIAGWWDWLVERITDFIHWFTDGWRGCFDDALETLRSWGSNIRDFFTGLVDGIGEIWGNIQDLLRDPINGVITLVNDYLIDGFNAVSNIVHGPQIGHIDPMPAAHAATGMIVPGYQSSKRDEVPAMLRKGEGVLVPEVVREIGPQTILEWNRRANLGQKIRHFAYGGLVDQIVAFERKSGVPFNVTSGVRNSNDLHGQGMAVDTADSAANMVKLASWLYGYSPYLLELIHSGGAGFFVKNGAKKGKAFYGAATVAEHFSHVHTAMNEAGLLAVQEGADPADGDDEEPTGLAATLINRLKDKIKDGIAKAIGSIRESTLGKIAIGMTDTLVGDMGQLLIDKAKALASAVTDVVGDAAGWVKSLFTDEEDTSAHAKGEMAAPLTAAQYAKSQLSAFGWDTTDMTNLAKLWNGESGWRWNAKNVSSGAYGIPQSLPGTKMASVGADWATNAFTQVLWGMGYIKDRYDNPTNAYLTWLGRNPHWYDTGGYLPPGLTLAYNGTGRHERVMTAEQEQAMMRERSALLQGRADVNIHVHDGKVSGLVTAEVDKQFGLLADDFVYGGL